MAAVAARVTAAPQSGTSAGMRMPSAEALVSAACAEEARAAATSLAEDEAALAALVKWETVAAAAAEAATQQSAISSAQEVQRELSTQGAAGEGSDEGDCRHVGGPEAEGDAPGQGSEAVTEQVDPVLPPFELGAFDGDVERLRTVLLFRTAKKRVLAALAGAS
jgi:hypothetical protein